MNAKAKALSKAMVMVNEYHADPVKFKAESEMRIQALKEKRMNELLLKAKEVKQINDAREVEHSFNPVRELTEMEIAQERWEAQDLERKNRRLVD
jgi:hypothetical protein